jgi:hypothetical protein
VPTQRERGLTDTYHERITTGSRFREDLHLLAVDEAKLEQSPLERREWSGARADADHAAAGARRQRREAHEARFQAKTSGGSDSIHAAQYE